MLALRRAFSDGPDRPELVLLHGAARPADASGPGDERFTLVMTPSPERGKREARIFLPEPRQGGGCRLRYRFSTVRAGREWFSPDYDMAFPEGECDGDVARIEEHGTGNLRPAPGRGTFRLVLPLRHGEPRTGAVRFGFGAMRKKPSAELCRATLPLGGEAPVVEIPEALSVLKDRPMPFFLYHVGAAGGPLYADKINCARLTLRDEAGEIVCARLLWGDAAWTAQNLSVMEVKNFAPPQWRASDYFFAEDREAYLRERWSALERHPVPRTFEAYVFGPEGSVVEYCFQLLLRRPDGSTAAAWRNRGGSNWTVTL